MKIYEDTRNQKGKHKNINAQLEALGHEVYRQGLDVGDYTEVNNQTVCIDTKKDLQEVAGNLSGGIERFKREGIRAQERGKKLIVLIETEDAKNVDDVERWTNPRLVRWLKIKNAHAKGKALNVKISKKPPIKGSSMAKTMRTYEKEYGIEWRFCSPENTGTVIAEVLQEKQV